MIDRFIYFPERTISVTPGRYGLAGEDLTVSSEDGTALHGWWIRGKGEKALLFFHGNAGNIGHRLDRTAIVSRRFGLDVFLVDYRGYGRSEGTPSEEGLYRDARAIHGAAVSRGFAGRIVAFGESLGSAVAIQLAMDLPCTAVILETPFLSIQAMAREHYPLVPAFLVPKGFDNEQKVPTLTPPKLFLIAEHDEIAPPGQGLRLFAEATEPKTLYVIPGAGHNDTYVTGGDAYWRVWDGFLASIP